LEEKCFGSLAEALSDVQGIDVGGEVGKTDGLNISVRGMPSDYAFVLIYGRRQNPRSAIHACSAAAPKQTYIRAGPVVSLEQAKTDQPGRVIRIAFQDGDVPQSSVERHIA
jgi:outer membrane receptor for ferrienterochelin and colicin